MKKRPTFKEFQEKSLKQQDFKVEYEKLKPEFDLIKQLIIARKRSKLSQAELATRLHTKQPAIARLENGRFSQSSLSKINEYANALGYDLKIRLIRRSSNPNSPTN